MPFYHQLGRIPHKRHTAFRQSDGGLYYEQLIGNKGFSGLSSLLYHTRRPTMVKATRFAGRVEWIADPDQALRMRHFRLGGLPQGGSPVTDRHPVLFNNDVGISLVHPDKTDDVLFRNAQGDEVIYMADGEGVVESLFGELSYRRGDYVVIPRGITYRLRPRAGASSPVGH